MVAPNSTSKLFQPIKVGHMTLSHRVVLAPLTRSRATATTHVPLIPTVSEYYSQRASTPGTLLIAEATLVAAKAGGRRSIPGIWSDDQIAAWKEVTDAVHANGSFIYLQIRALGRAAEPLALTAEDPSFPYVSASSVSFKDKQAPRPLTVSEIDEYVQLFATAASNGVHRAGFDGVEIHGANGYLVDQFLQDVTNKRSDDYGGTVKNRVRFGLEVVEAIVKAVGAEKTGIRLSPWSTFLEMSMPDPKPTFSYFVSQIRDLYPTFSYVHLIEPSIAGNTSRDPSSIGSHESNDFIREIWAPRPLISAGDYTRQSAIDVADNKGDLIAFGRYYISNPDLPLRLQHDIPLTPYDRSTFYVAGDTSGKGYTDYPFYRTVTDIN